tara:strand:- start:1259 stop:1456 length:198 start_codon:yes stop_codon:yes gene_type:complete
MISILIYLLTDYDIFEVVKNISTGRVEDYPLWERILVQISFTLDVFMFTVLFIAAFFYAIGGFNF